MGTRPEFGHGPQVASLEGGRALEANPEESAVEFRDRDGRGRVHFGSRHAWSVGNLPAGATPLLEEIGISLRDSQDFLEGVRLVCDAEAVCRRLERLLGGIAGQGTDFGEGEHPLGVGFRDADVAHELGQSGSDQSDRQPALRDPVQGRDECAEFLSGHVLHLVDEQDEHRLAGTGRLSRDLEQRREIGVQVSAVRDAFFRINPAWQVMSV